MALIPVFGSLSAQTTVLSSPVGVISDRPSVGHSGFAFPLIRTELAVGVISTNTGTVLELSAAAGDVHGAISAGGRYYVEVVTGPLEGERLDVDAAATLAAGPFEIVVVLGAGAHSTLGGLPVDALAGARCAVRPHVALADLPAMFSPALAGNRDRYRADAVWILGTAGFDRFHLGEDNESWHSDDLGEWAQRFIDWHRRGSRTAPRDYRDLVIPPDVSVVVDINTGAKAWTHEGIVRTNNFRKNLVRGIQAFSSGFPVDLSPIEIGAFVDSGIPAANRWKGSYLFPLADQIEILASQRAPIDLYFLRGDGHSWQALTRSWREDFSDDPILGGTDMILIRRNNPDPAFVIARPFAP